MAQADFAQGALNAGLLGAYALPFGATQKVAANAAYGSLAAGTAFAAGAARATAEEKAPAGSPQEADSEDNGNA